MKTMMLTAACLISISACENAELFDNLLRGSPMDGGSGRMVSDLAMKPPDLTTQVPEYSWDDKFDSSENPVEADLVQRDSGKWLLLDVGSVCDWKIGPTTVTNDVCSKEEDKRLNVNITGSTDKNGFGKAFPVNAKDRCLTYIVLSSVPPWPAGRVAQTTVEVERVGPPQANLMTVLPEGELYIALLDSSLNVIGEQSMLASSVSTYKFSLPTSQTNPIYGLALIYKHNTKLADAKKEGCFQVKKLHLGIIYYI